jgi:outer membrane biosynthesis protein TonB
MPPKHKRKQSKRKVQRHKKLELKWSKVLKDEQLIKTFQEAQAWMDLDPENSERKAAEKFALKRSTFRRWRKDPTAHKHKADSQVGGTGLLTYKAEADLRDFLLEAAELGFALSKEKATALCRAWAKHIKEMELTESSFGQKWWSRYLERNPELYAYTPKMLARKRAEASTEDNVLEFLNLVKATREKHKQNRMWNVDETGFGKDDKAPRQKLLAGNAAQAVQMTQDQLPHVSTVVSCSNEGDCGPILTIWKGKNILGYMTKDAYHGGRTTVTAEGFITADVWTQYMGFLTDYIRNVLGSTKTEIILVDGHKSHFPEELVVKLMRENFVLISLPAHLSHILQPLDQGVFALAKLQFRKAKRDFLEEEASNGRSGAILTKQNLNTLFNNKTYDSFKSEKHIKAGWERAGLWPHDPVQPLSKHQGALRLGKMVQATKKGGQAFADFLQGQSLESKVREACENAEEAGEGGEEKKEKMTSIKGKKDGKAVIVTSDEFLLQVQEKRLKKEKEAKEKEQKKRKREEDKVEKQKAKQEEQEMRAEKKRKKQEEKEMKLKEKEKKQQEKARRAQQQQKPTRTKSKAEVRDPQDFPSSYTSTSNMSLTNTHSFHLCTDSNDEEWDEELDEESDEEQDEESTEAEGEEELNPYQYCVCEREQGATEEVWIECSGPSRECPGNKWYHLDCTKLKTIPKGEWFCNFCK